MARRTIENRDELGGAMISHAENIISSEGAGALTARRIAGLLGVSVGTVYNVFPAMDALVGAVNARTLDRFKKEIENIPLNGRDTADVLFDFADTYMFFVDGNRNLWSVLFEGDLPPEDSPNQLRTDELFQFLEQAITQSIGDPQTRAISARTLWATVHGILSMAYAGRMRVLRTNDVRALVRFAIKAHLEGVRAGVGAQTG